jgi:hypothetical protein
MNTLNMPGFTAEDSLYISNLSYRQVSTTANAPLVIQPAAIHVCNRLGQASWDAYSQGDYDKVQFIDFLMTLAGCFD